MRMLLLGLVEREGRRGLRGRAGGGGVDWLKEEVAMIAGEAVEAAAVDVVERIAHVPVAFEHGFEGGEGGNNASHGGGHVFFLRGLVVADVVVVVGSGGGGGLGPGRRRLLFVAVHPNGTVGPR